MCSQITLGFTQPGEKPVTVHSGDASPTRQHSIKKHATQEKVHYVEYTTLTLLFDRCKNLSFNNNVKAHN